ncbi:MAG: Gldg family protein [Clostridia bacterium]|nr:Gldg family protein [Clostridia bacterium]
MAHSVSRKALRHGGVTVALTVLIVAVIILLNASVTTLAMRFGWYVNMNPTLLYPVTDTCYDYLDTYVMNKTDEEIHIIFCDEEENIREDSTLMFVQSTADELAARYPDKVKVDYLNVWENPRIARSYGVTASTSVVVALGSEDASGQFHATQSRVCTLRDFFLFPANDTSNPVAYNGEKRFAVAMKAVVTPDAPVAYLTLNHGESTEDYALMYAVTDAGYMVNYLDALSFDIPEDCGLLITYNPARDFTAVDGVSGVSEIDKLDAYLKDGGKFMCFVSADTFAAGGFDNLESYLTEWGVTFAHDTGAEGIEECFALRDTAHAITTDGYTLLGQIPSAGRGARIMGNVDGTFRAANATAIQVADGFTAQNGDYVKGTRTLSPLLRTYAGAEAWAGGRPVDRTSEGYNLVTLTQDAGGQHGSVLVCSSTEFAVEATLQSGVYGNGPFLLTAMEAMGKDEVPVELKSQPFSDDTIHILTTAQARNITIALVAVPVLVVTVWGLIVLIRRKFA